MLFRGNVDTRLGKLAAGEADATLLAAAGLERLRQEKAALAARVDLGEGDSRALAAELAAQYPPELADPLREEIARLIRR